MVFYSKTREIFMTVSGTYVCNCGKHFHDTFSDDEESICPECKGETATAPSQAEFDFLKPQTLEEIEGIPYI